MAAVMVTTLRQRLALWGRFWYPWRSAVALLLLCQAGQAVASLTLPAITARVVDLGILQHDRSYVLRGGAEMVGIGLIQVFFSIGAAWLGARVAIGIGADLRSAVFARIQTFSMHELSRFGTPSLITRTTNDVQQVQNFFVMVLTMIVTAPIMGIGGVVMALRLDVGLSMLLAVSVPLLATLVGVLLTRALPLFARMQDQIDRITLVLREQITGQRVIRAFVRDAHEEDRFASVNEGLTDTARRVGRLMSLNMPTAHLIMQLSAVAVVWLAAERIAAGELQVGILVAFLSYIMQILIAVMIASMLFVMAPRALVSARRVREVLETQASVADPAHARPLPPGTTTRARVEFRNVSFAYPGAERAVLRHVSFTIEPGHTVAVIGATGAGKSTIVQLIARLFDVTDGAILINDVDIREFHLEDLWSLLGLVPQEAFLFSGTVGDNLRYGRADASDDALWQALDIAQARDFVAALPGQLQAPVAQGGTGFSGGQRQRLTIARALVRQAPIYLLDDSFSALDYVTDARLRSALRGALRDAAVLIVGQRVSSLRHADTILLIEEGVIVAAGTHEHLMRESAGYREIVASQDAGDDSPELTI